MKKSLLSQTLQSKLGLVLLASTIGLSACSNETEERADSSDIESSEMTPVNTESNIEATSQAENNEDQMTSPTEGEGAVGKTYYSGSGNTENEEKAVDEVDINESNPNLNKTAADGLE